LRVNAVMADGGVVWILTLLSWFCANSGLSDHILPGCLLLINQVKFRNLKLLLVAV